MRQPVGPRLREAGRRDRRRAWIYLGLAYVLGVPIVAAWVEHFAHPSQTEEDLALANTGLGLLTVLLGLPALILLVHAMTRSGRARRSTGKVGRDWAMIIPVGLFVSLAIGGGVIAQNKLPSETQRVQDRANVGMMDRSGIVVIDHGNQQYRNPNDRCSSPVGPPPTAACGRENRPSCRSQAWLVAHHAWPLTQIGTAPFFRPGLFGPGSPGVGGPGISRAILRPVAQDVPSILLIADGGCYLEYRRTT